MKSHLVRYVACENWGVVFGNCHFANLDLRPGEILTVGETNIYLKSDIFARYDFTYHKRLHSLLHTLGNTFWIIIDGLFPVASIKLSLRQRLGNNVDIVHQ
jgi:hypothetical protein